MKIVGVAVVKGDSEASGSISESRDAGPVQLVGDSYEPAYMCERSELAIELALGESDAPRIEAGRAHSVICKHSESCVDS
ncbi:hypothetical protein [Ilumatobacter nonamiensis]|uniref:hypothetical protein n=1 Tax=Ilumatobacter nonamiensis TaxID=467093 RepID=UPI001F4C7F1B|nr:hypothetical protein [Ilumatobacter nonamiensis]